MAEKTIREKLINFEQFKGFCPDCIYHGKKCHIIGCVLCFKEVDELIELLAKEGYGKMVDSSKWIQTKGKYFNDYEEVQGKVFELIK
jgi:hypothetical protein